MNQEHNFTTQANQYDKIIKENLEVTLPALIRDVLELEIFATEELPDDVQHTKERKPDALKRVTDMLGNTYVLHLEFQLSDEKEMVYRMAEYSIMLMRKYKLPIKQYVIYLKDNKPLMPTFLDTADHKFSFNLIRLAEIDYRIFLNSNNPEIQMLGILANFGTEDSNVIAASIVNGIGSTAKGEFAQIKHYKQLRIYAKLRKNIELQIVKAMESVSTFFKEEEDFLYLKGEALGQSRGEEKKSREVVENLIVKLGLTNEQAALGAAVDITYVEKVRAELKK